MVSKKQLSVALSSTEAEYISAAVASQEVIWIRQLLKDFGLFCLDPVIIFEDNQGCIKLACNTRINPKTKHIDVKYHHLRDLIENEIIKFEYCESKQMIADILTKPLPRIVFEGHRSAMGIT